MTEIDKILKNVEAIKNEWELVLDCLNDLVVLTDNNDIIIRCNIPFSTFVKQPFENILNKKLQDLLHERELVKGSYIEEENGIEFFDKQRKKYFIQRNYNVTDEGGISGVVIIFSDNTKRKLVTQQLEKAYKELKASQAQLLQQEKMASIGQLAAGVAHEINNPVGFVTSNLGTLNKYSLRLAEYIEAMSNAFNDNPSSEKTAQTLNSLRKKLKIDYVIEDSLELIKESLDGVERVKKIVQNLKSFSRIDQSDCIMADINQCLEDTLNIVWNELKYKTTVHKEYGELPLTKCYPQQLNQVFMNLLVNASHAIDKKGEIGIKTWSDDNNIYAVITDTGCGIPEENLNRIFEPFFTTKEVGKGTGLGLSITYDIVTQKHNGEITVESQVGKGSTFTVKIPITEGE